MDCGRELSLGASEGRSNNALAKELKTSRPTIVDWRARYVEGGVKALYEDRLRGRSFEGGPQQGGGDCR